jgi:hypothetical protein
MEEDAEVEDIFKKRPKKIKSGIKGKRVELEVVKSLNERFSKVLAANPDGGKFSRSVGSGNRWGQNVHLSKNAVNTYSGDIVCPEGFLFVLESKGGYNDIDLCLRLRSAGFAIVYQPHVQATHWEGRTRTAKETAKDVFVARWQHAFPCDPFYHPHLAATDFRPDGLGRFWRQRKTAALAELLAGREQAVPPLARRSRAA